MSFIIGTEFCKYFVFGDAHWDYSTYDLANWSRDSRLVASFVNASDPDLAAFRAGGGKLILWHGWCDGLATPLTSNQYYEDVEKRDPQVRDFFRLFMLPGVRHFTRQRSERVRANRPTTTLSRTGRSACGNVPNASHPNADSETASDHV